MPDQEWHFVMRQRTALLAVMAQIFPCWLQPPTPPDAVCNWSLWLELPTGLTAWHVPDSCIDVLSFVDRKEPQGRVAVSAEEREQRLLAVVSYLKRT